MLYLKSLTGDEFPLVATTTNNDEVSGNQTLTATIYPNKNNLIFLNDLSEMMWNIVDHEGTEHKIIYVKKEGKGHSMMARIKAYPLFFDNLRRQRIYPRTVKHMTAQECYGRIFENLGFDFVLTDHFDAIQWDGFGEGKSKMELFQSANDRYKAEFRIEGHTVFLESKIGVDLNFRYQHRFNASNISQETDAENLTTYIRGYADYDDDDLEDGGWESARITETYTSPLASIIGRYDAKPIKDGRIKNRSVLLDRMKKVVEESLLVNIYADIVNLRRQKYPESNAKVGDRLYVIDPRIGLDQEVRVIRQSITRDFRGNIIDINAEFGSDNLSSRRQSTLRSSNRTIKEVMSGDRKIPIQSIDDSVVKGAAQISGLTSELDIRQGISTKDGGVRFNNGGIITTATSGNPRPTVTSSGLNAETLYGSIPSEIIEIDTSEIESQIQDIQTQVDTVEGEVGTNTSDIASINTSISNIQTDVQEIKDDIQEIKDDIQEIFDTLNNLDND